MCPYLQHSLDSEKSNFYPSPLALGCPYIGSVQGKRFCSIVCKQLLWEAPVVFLGRSRARLSLRRYTGDLGRSGGPVPGPQHGADVRQEGSGEGQGSQGSRVIPGALCTPRWFPFSSGICWVCLVCSVCPLFANVTRARVRGEGPQWEDVWRRDLSARATWESRSGRSLCAKNRNSAQQQGNDKIRESRMERGAAGVCGRAEGREWSPSPEAPMWPRAEQEERAGGRGTCGAAPASRGMCSCRDIAESKSSSWLQEHTR